MKRKHPLIGKSFLILAGVHRGRAGIIIQAPVGEYKNVVVQFADGQAVLVALAHLQEEKKQEVVV